jgi:3-oxoadipate enol-lactonase
MPETILNATSIHYQVLGEGEPVAFLNGVFMTAQSWVLQTGPLRRRYQCILHDFRGQLLSPLEEEGCTLEQHAEDLAALFDHLGVDSSHLVGTSYGGEVGMIFALAHPDRVRSLSVISSVSHIDPLLREQVDRWSEVAATNPSAFFRFVASTVYSNRFLAETPSLIRDGEERLKELPSTFFRDVPKLIRAFQQLEITTRLGSISCPTLVLCGEQDALKPVHYSRTIAAAIPGAELLIVPDAGHAVVLERPEEVTTALMGFLEKHRG